MSMGKISSSINKNLFLFQDENDENGMGKRKKIVYLNDENFSKQKFVKDISMFINIFISFTILLVMVKKDFQCKNIIFNFFEL